MHYLNLGYVYKFIGRGADLPEITRPIDRYEYINAAIYNFKKFNKVIQDHTLESNYKIKMLDGLLDCYTFLIYNPKDDNVAGQNSTWNIESFKFDFYNIDNDNDSVTRYQYELVNHAGVEQLMAEAVANSFLVIDLLYSDLTNDEQIYVNLWKEKADLLKEYDFNEYLNDCGILATAYKECHLLKDDLKFKLEFYEDCKKHPNPYYQLHQLYDISKLYKELSQPLYDTLFSMAKHTSSNEEMISYLYEYFKTVRFLNEEYIRLSDQIGKQEFLYRNSIKIDIEKANIEEAEVRYDLANSIKTHSAYNDAITLMEQVMQYENYDDDFYEFSRLIRELKAKVGISEAFGDINQKQKSEFEEVLTTFKYASSEQRRTLWNNFLSKLENNISLGFTNYQSNQASELLYNSLLIKKGVLLNTDKNFIDALTSFDSDSNSFNETRNEFFQLLKTSPQSNRLKFLEQELLKTIRYVDYNKNLTTYWEEVKTNLSDKQCAIEFGEIQHIDGTKDLFAVIINNIDQFPRTVYIGKYNEIMPLDLEFICHLEKTLNEFIGNRDKVFFSPDGLLYQIPIENLITSKKWTRLSSTRELITKNPNQTQPISQIALFGGLNFNMKAQIEPNPQDERNEVLVPDHLRAGVEQLPFTKEEVLNISYIIKNKGLTPLLYIEDKGSECELYSLLQSRRIDVLHFATHGYYYTLKDIRRLGLDYNNLSHSENESEALFRSGILLSGAHANINTLSLKTNPDDGLLTAYEVQSLNLSKLQLVVLSACQTGLGDITGDGVFGLQRGFKKAGANSLLLSLWKVDDRATQMLMTKFYENFLNGKSKIESLTLAQQYVREFEEDVEVAEETNMTASQKRRNKIQGDEVELAAPEKVKVKPFQAPKYWAAFILLDALD